MRNAPKASVTTDCSCAPFRYRLTVQPVSRRSVPSATRSKSASCQTVPFSTPTPGVPPTSIETLALSDWGGLFQVATPTFVTVVPIARFGSIEALKRRTTDSPGPNCPYEPE